MKFVCKLMSMLFLLASIPLSANSVNNRDFYLWLAEEHKKNPELNTNELIWSNQFQKFLDTNVSNPESIYLGMTEHKDKDFNYHLYEVLGGPPDKVQFNRDGTILISGCRHSSCDEKGFIWIDTVNANQIFAVISYFFGQAYRADGYVLIYTDLAKSTNEMPEKFTESLTAWLDLHELKNLQTILINATSKQ